MDSNEYEVILKRYKILPVGYLLEYYDLLFLNSLLNGKSCLNPFDYISFNNSVAGLRSENRVEFSIKRTKKVVTLSSYFNRIVPLANFLSRTSDTNLFDKPKKYKSLLKTFYISMIEKFKMEQPCSRGWDKTS